NPMTPEKVALGKLLFYDPILSGEKDVSCASCHHPQFGFADGRELSLGVGAEGLGPNRQDKSGGRIPVVRRNAPSLINVAFNGLVSGEFYEAAQAPMFWDNRVRSLEQQALEPIKAHEEMRGDAFSEAVALDSVVARLQGNTEYEAGFLAAFPNEGPISEALLGKALAAYQRSLIAPNSRFDQYLRGNSTALEADEIEGMNQFVSRGCIACHGGPMLSDYRLHVLGVAEHPDLTQLDRGNGQDQFRTPTLRNIALTAPYMHNGTQATLEEVMQFYNDQESLHPEVTDGELAQEFQDLTGMSNRRRAQIIAFMESMTDEPKDLSVPQSVPSGLPVGGR
ncbi:MAG: cytochrome c peroxidase, partial [Bacteroidota bacterium]